MSEKAYTPVDLTSVAVDTDKGDCVLSFALGEDNLRVFLNQNIAKKLRLELMAKVKGDERTN